MYQYTDPSACAKAVYTSGSNRCTFENAKDDTDPDQVLLVLQARFIIAQLRAADGRPDQALADLRAIRPAFVSVYGADSTQVRNLDKQADRLNRATRTTPPPR